MASLVDYQCKRREKLVTIRLFYVFIIFFRQIKLEEKTFNELFTDLLKTEKISMDSKIECDETDVSVDYQDEDHETANNKSNNKKCDHILYEDYIMKIKSWMETSFRDSTIRHG
eukprot:GHVL01010169.1.p1 GENE.GHVL01010169.1~~GHVL01010169.1.p1  ORF type:complete len:114 (+),score=22.58 GHVL01010169.1:314-655(+)